ncbi:MAG: sigma-E processing peptidase SpoIIGA [Bacillota bacterium]|nr:sigma-E processing peptidase SpoIIGA [Bacillota bacterium]
MVVYADLFFLTNWGMDYLLLWATARFAGVRARWLRLAASSFLGAAYATAFLFPAARPLYSVSAKAAFSLVMVAVAFPVRSLAHLGRLWGCFAVLSLVAGGGAIALAYLSLPGLGGPFPGIPSWLVGLAVAITLAMAGRAWAYRRQHDNLTVLPAEVILGARRVVFPALVDTGNRLRDPFTGAPVLVVEYGTARRLVPRPLQPLLLGRSVPDVEQAGGGSPAAPHVPADRGAREAPVAPDAWDAPQAPGAAVAPGAHHPLAERFCIVPFVALGSQRGVLYGFRPDRVRVQQEGGWQRLGPVVVGVCPDVLSPDGWYRGLLPQEALEKERGGGGDMP